MAAHPSQSKITILDASPRPEPRWPIRRLCGTPAGVAVPQRSKNPRWTIVAYADLAAARSRRLRMSAAPFRIEFDRDPALPQTLYRCMYALMAQISQTAACNRFHEAEPRLARWLLMTRDRVMSDEFPLTHEFLAHMLGMRREGVTEAASGLKRRKPIAYQRGEIQILDLKRLKAASCSCYQIVQTAFKRVRG
jgi:hypothetical protein